MALNRNWYNTLVDDSGTGTNGTVWDKSQIDQFFGVIDFRVRDWVPVPFAAGNFYSDTGSWTVEAGDVAINRIALTGQLAVWDLVINATTVGGSPSTLYLVVPFQYYVLSTSHFGRIGYCLDNMSHREAYVHAVNSGTLGMSRNDSGTWTPSTNATYLYLQAVFGVSN
jgi:hypothetical protein